MNKEEIVAFLKTKDHTVIFTLSVDGKPDRIG